MNAITKLTAVALGALSIAGGVAVAQSTSPDDGRAKTANYGTPPGAPLKRDGSLSADPKAVTPTMSTPADTSSTTTTTTSTTNWNNPPAAAATTETPVAAAPAPDTSTASMAPADTTPKPRADRN